VNDLPRHVEQSIRTRGLLVRGQRLLVAVSGGVDSMVLLHVLHGVTSKYGWKLTVAHLNHGLRGRSSDADERLVRRTAEKLKLPSRIARADVRRSARAQGKSLEMAARKLRHDFLADTAQQLRIPTIALAHQADDQVELFFLRLLRGSSGEGLAGMRWRSPSPANSKVELVRPLLDQPKFVLLNYAEETGIRFREDATNASLDIQRNRIRHELIPLLRSHYQPALSKIVLRLMDILGAEAELVTQAASGWFDRRTKHNRLARKRGDASISFEELPLAVQRGIVQLQLLRHGIAADFSLIEDLRSAADKPVTIGPMHHVPEDSSLGKLAARQTDPPTTGGSGDVLTVGHKPELTVAVRDNAGIIHLKILRKHTFIPESTQVRLGKKAGKAQFSGALIEWRISYSGRTWRLRPPQGRESFDADKVGSPILLRHWKPGDRFQPIGMARPVKLQDFFTNEKVPPAQRRQLIVAATAKQEIFWVEGMRISERFKLSQQTIRRLQWRWKRP
jgi:tRNA(Ile)-lysidine synthase